jgi:hypothetical protein
VLAVELRAAKKTFGVGHKTILGFLSRISLSYRAQRRGSESRIIFLCSLLLRSRAKAPSRRLPETLE